MQNALITPQKDLQSPVDWVDVDDIVRPPPRAGTGVHPWLFGQACQLKEIGATPEEARMYIQASLDKHPPGRDVPDRELSEAVRNAFAVAGERANGPSWPQPKAEDIKAIVERDGAFTLDKLKKCSPRESVRAAAKKSGKSGGLQNRMKSWPVSIAKAHRFLAVMFRYGLSCGSWSLQL